MGVSGWNCPASDIRLATTVNGQGRQKSTVTIFQVRKYLSRLLNGLRESVGMLDSPLQPERPGFLIPERVGHGLG